MSRRPGRRRRERASIDDFRAAPGQNPLFVSRRWAALADAEAAKGRKLTRAEMRELEDVIRAGIEYHAVPDPADERSVTEAIGPVPEMDWPVPAAQVEAQRAASGPQPALYAPPPESHPYPQGPQPTFTPHDAYEPEEAEEDEQPVRTVIFDSLPALAPEPEPAPPPVPGSSPALYAGPGWTARLMSARVASGEWDELPAIVERGLGRNAAEEAAGFRHSRTAIADGVRHRCTVIGVPGLAEELLRRTHELTMAARAQDGEAA